MRTTSLLGLGGALLVGACLLVSCVGTESELEHQGLDGPGNLALIPIPQSIEVREGTFRWSPGQGVAVHDQVLLDWELDKRLLEVIDPNGLHKVDVKGPHGPDSGVHMLIDSTLWELGREGYKLDIRGDSLAISSAWPTGVFYGIQTLRQLLPQLAGQAGASAGYSNWSVPACEIIDAPRFGWRGQLLDVSRHFLPLEFVKKNIDYLAALKLNVFHWHLTDDQGWRVPVQAYPKLTSVGAWRVDKNDLPWHGRPEQAAGEVADYGGSYSREEITEVIEYARLRGVTVVPEIDVPGHCRAAIAAYPELSCDGVARGVATGGIMEENALCPGREATFEFVEEVLVSVMGLFPSEYIHIGGDECNKSAWKSCVDCQGRMAEESLEDVDQLQSYFIRRVEGIINAHGRKMIGWDEILEGGLAPNAVVMSWRGEAGGIEAAKAGHDVIMTPSEYCYLDLKQGLPETEPELGYSELLLSTAYSYEPLPAELTSEQSKHILGIQGNLWGESIRGETEANYMLFPRLFAVAEVAWSQPDRKDWRGFIDRLDPILPRLKAQGIGYAPSLYQVALHIKVDAANAQISLAMDTEHGDVEMRYTTDGTEPTSTSTRYEAPLQLAKSTLFQAAAFRDGLRLGRITEKMLDLHKAMGKSMDSPSVFSPKYNGGGGANPLIDGNTGSATHSDKRWVGFEASSMEATLDLGALTVIKEVAIGCLEEQNSWIFYPQSMEVLGSRDGVHFRRLGVVQGDPTAASSGAHRKELTLATPGEQTRYLRVRAESIGTCPDWHKGNGGKAWIFLDEIIVR
ncbi:MAG: family 20 glycosylhydrolase [Planctomycetota bacterium]|nr:family 20 glycosylhydrolase [Planctomycetota bacterium]